MNGAQASRNSLEAFFATPLFPSADVRRRTRR